jgi:hypothetical protein
MAARFLKVWKIGGPRRNSNVDCDLVCPVGQNGKAAVAAPCVIQVLRSSIAERIVFDAGVKPIYF